MKALTKTSDAEPVNGMFSPGGGKRGAHIRTAGDSRSGQLAGYLAEALPSMRRQRGPSKTAAGRAELAPIKTKRTPPKPFGPTPERLAKGDISPVRTAGGFHRAVSPVERLYKLRKLSANPDDIRENLALFQAAERLKRHYDGLGLSISAQDPNRVIGHEVGDDTKQDAWVDHRRNFEVARTLMGFNLAHPRRGSSCIVVAVVCEEKAVTDAAEEHLIPARKEVMVATAMDRLREGLWVLACHWKMI